MYIQLISRRGTTVVKACSRSSSSSSALVDGCDSVAALERCFAASPASTSSATDGGGVVMKGQYGATTLEKSKLDLSQKQTKSNPQLFDRKLVDAVLKEWKKTMMDLPAGFRQAYEMGLVSSAEMTRFLSIHARPTTQWYISRLLPEGVSRAFNGRMMADPTFIYKLLLEQTATFGCSVWWEVKNRKQR